MNNIYNRGADVGVQRLDQINVLISLHRGYGLGDAVQMSAVLRHVAKHRPHWRVDFQAEDGRQCIGRGITANQFSYGRSHPTSVYDAEVQLLLYDTWANWSDRPNTRVSSVLHERLDMEWDRECGRYRVEVSAEAVDMAHVALYGRKSGGAGKVTRDLRYVAVHYEGDSSPAKKNLSHRQIDDVCQAIQQLGREPVILDWRNRSPLKYAKLVNPNDWGGDAEKVCAVISQCEAFVGIDSGPSKCASATDTPALVVWTGHHPAPFHDPASNTTHLVPCGYHGLDPVCEDRGVIEWFEANYQVRHYKTDPVVDIKAWLRGVLV